MTYVDYVKDSVDSLKISKKEEKTLLDSIDTRILQYEKLKIIPSSRNLPDRES